MKYQRNVHQAAMMITQFSIHMLVPILACTFLGIRLDKKLGTNWIMVVLFFVGALAGGRNVFLFAKRIYSMEGDKRNRDLSGENEYISKAATSASIPGKRVLKKFDEGSKEETVREEVPEIKKE